jgi:hypothetical protein
MTSSARGWLRWAWLVAAAIAIAVSGQYLVKNAWWDTEDMPTLQAAIKDSAGFEGTDEYDPAGDDHTDLVQKEPRAKFVWCKADAEGHSAAKVLVEKWTAEHRAVRVVARGPGRVALHLLNYPAWRVTLNGNRVVLLHANGTEQMVVPVPVGESELQIDFTRTWDRTAGGWFSVASLAASIALLYARRRAPAAVNA